MHVYISMRYYFLFKLGYRAQKFDPGDPGNASTDYYT
jgi:hypothetical protein